MKARALVIAILSAHLWYVSARAAKKEKTALTLECVIEKGETISNFYPDETFRSTPQEIPQKPAGQMTIGLFQDALVLISKDGHIIPPGKKRAEYARLSQKAKVYQSTYERDGIPWIEIFHLVEPKPDTVFVHRTLVVEGATFNTPYRCKITTPK